jgi:hypothetical protein
MVHYRVPQSPPLIPILSQMNPVHTTPSYLSKIHINIVICRVVRATKMTGSDDWIY